MIVSKVLAFCNDQDFHCIVVFFLNGSVCLEVSTMEIVDQLAERNSVFKCLESVNTLFHGYGIVAFCVLLQGIGSRVVDVCGVS